MTAPFFGREIELERLNRLLNKKASSLVVIRGRRRIGKSRLAQEFGKNIRSYTFMGLPPEEGKVITAQMQRDEFLRQMSLQLGVRGLNADDWGDLFFHVFQK